MPETNLEPFYQNFNPTKRSRQEIASEIRRVDAAIKALAGCSAPLELLLAGDWQVVGNLSLPIALRSLRKYRQRLARAGR